MARLPPHNPYAHLDHSYQYPLNAHHSQPSHAFPQATPISSSSAPPTAPFARAASFSSSTAPAASPFPPQASWPMHPGTVENPLIPKRRRRTTPAELAILESEYRSNPRPDPLERARIAERLGMTARAVQVWYQNRRQKEKKESSSFGGSSTASSVASSGSDPRDLDGVVLSFSSSPLPSPNLPLYPTVAGGSAAADPFKALAAPSSELYSSSGPAANKENTAVPAASRPAATPLQSASAPASTNYVYQYSYPSSAGNPPPPSSASVAGGSSSSVPSVYLHRPHNASIIAAKKHVRKRPLGSHAPLARTPSLPHAFEFPPSPEKASASAAEAPLMMMARKASLNDVVTRQQTATSAGVELRRSASLTAGSGLGLFGQGVRGETVASRRRSSTPMSVIGGGEDVASPVEEDEPAQLPEQPAPAPTSLAAMTPASKAKAKDDLLRHMESDPPTASSPVQPLTRRRMAAHDAAFASAAVSDEEDAPAAARPPPFVGARPLLPARSFSSSSAPAAASSSFGSFPANATAAVPLSRSTSHQAHVARSLPLLSASSTNPLKRAASAAPVLPSSSAAVSGSASPATAAALSLDGAIAAAASHARAPGTGRSGEMACAVEALGRKRARIMENGSAAVVKTVRRGGSSAGLRLDLAAGGGAGGKRGRTVTAPQQQQNKRRRSSGMTASTASTFEEEDELDADADGETDLGDLSFSSTSTASTVDSLVTVADSPAGAAGYFALGSAAAQAMEQENKSGGVGAKVAGQADDERECAELLLSMGGFF
ncbi:hypothetical protein JCM6882_007927 [Rhodosporidiobolus microsporus]